MLASCLVLDIRLPGVSGLDFQPELAEADIRIPIIFMTGHGDIPMSVKGDESWSHRLSDEAVPRPRYPGCRDQGDRARSKKTR